MELLQHNPSLFFSILFISFFLTLLVYGAFPIIFAKARKKPITKKKYKKLCSGINIIGIAFFIILDGAASFGPYFLWTWVFSNSGVRILEKKGLLSNVELIETKNIEAPKNKCETCGCVCDKLVVAKIEDGLGTRFANLCDECVEKLHVVPITSCKVEIAEPVKGNTPTSSAQFCRKCGANLIENSRFCRKCGTEIAETKHKEE